MCFILKKDKQKSLGLFKEKINGENKFKYVGSVFRISKKNMLYLIFDVILSILQSTKLDSFNLGLCGNLPSNIL